MIDETEDGLFPRVRVGIGRIDIAAENGNMQMSRGKLPPQIPAQAGAVMPGREIVITEGFSRRKLNMLNSKCLKTVKDLRERPFGTDVMSAHSKLDHSDSPFFCNYILMS